MSDEPLTDPVDDPITDKPTDDAVPPVNDYDPEKDIAIARAAQRARLEEIGGKFDANGDFLGFENTVPQSTSTTPAQRPLPEDATVEDVINNRLGEFETRVMGALQPAAATTVLSEVIKSHPELAPYESVAAKMLKSTPTSQVNEQYVMSLLYFARGQGADVEIAEARKKAKQESKLATEQLEAGAAAGSEGGPGAAFGKGKPKVIITPEIQAAAEAWGMKPEVLAEKYAARKAMAK